MSFRSFILFIIVAVTGCSAPRQVIAPASAPSEPIDFIVLQLNDVYEIAPLEGGKAGGLARVATLRQELLRENPNVITVMAGDFLSPSFLGTMRFTNEDGESERIAGLQMVETLNAMGLDYATFGNHEFDLSNLELLEKRMTQGTFAYTVCNSTAVTPEGEERTFMQGDSLVPKYLIHQIGNLKIGLVGVVLPFTQNDYVRYQDVTSSFQDALATVAPLTDLTLGITHQNLDEDEALAAVVADVPLFIGGHEHVKLSRYVGNTIIAKADANAKTVYVHRIRYDPASGMTDINSTIAVIDDSIAEEPATKAVVDKWQDKAFSVMEEMGYDPQREVLELTEPLVCKEALIRTSQTNYGQLTMEAIANALPGADAYFINSGTMRLDDNLYNVVTEYDILRTYPFGGKLVEVQLPGSVLKRALETGLRENYGEGGYLQVGNVDVSTLELIDGGPVEEGKSYRVVMPEFVAQGREANLGFLADHYNNDGKAELSVDNDTIKNDIRDIVIHHMERLETY